MSGLAVERCPHLGVLDRLDGLRCTPCDGPAPIAVAPAPPLVVDVCPSCDTPIWPTGECGCSD